MSRRPKQTFLQRRHTDGQQAHEKMLNITNYWRNATQNHNEYHLTPVKMATIKNPQTINTGEGMEKREPSYTVCENVSWYSHCGKQYAGFLEN